MFWLRNKKINFWLHTLIWRPGPSVQTYVLVLKRTVSRDGSFEHPQQMVWLRNKKNLNYTFLCGGLRFCSFLCVNALCPSQQFLDMSVQFPVFLGWTSTKQQLKCLAQGQNTVTTVSLQTPTSNSSIPSFTLYQLRHCASSRCKSCDNQC